MALDSSLVGIYRAIDSIHSTLAAKEIYKIKKNIFAQCWDHHLLNIVSEANPKHIIVIGKGRYSVEGILFERLMDLPNSFGLTVLPQPNIHGTSEEIIEMYKQYQRICSKYAP